MGATIGRTALAVVAATLTMAIGPSGAAAQFDVGGTPPGTDALATNPNGSHVKNIPLPPGFFGEGCQGVVVNSALFGDPLQEFGGIGVGAADTIVQRGAIPADPNPANVEIEIVELSLRSVEPFQVQCPGGAELWDLTVGVSPNNEPGQMQIFQNGQAAQFQAFFPVYPILTFTRVAGGPKQQIPLDIGEAPPEFKNGFFFNLDNGVGRFGNCEFPAFGGGGIGEGLCPGQPPDGSIVPLIAEAPAVRHEVFPAPPALEHFKCYTTQKKRFKKRRVSTLDQFAKRRYQVKKRKELCNPAQKNREAFVNQRAHQQCYAIKGRPINQDVVIGNQWGTQAITVNKPQRLCLPTRKKELPRGSNPKIQVPIAHQTCYSVKALSPQYDSGPGKPESVKTRDQFRKIEEVVVGNLKWLCAPTDKNNEGLALPYQHEACYSIRGKKLRRKVQIKNQFERTRIKPRKPKLLCLPTAKYHPTQTIG